MKRFLLMTVLTTALWSCGEGEPAATSTESIDSVETTAVDSVATSTDTTVVETPN